ncbi:hypothetical protein [Streptomyces sp. NPDC127114]|uniref:hypothetical protein n=1 Tax=Streptomyces sp. NPDC127114 TaxID=3345366 RepID=UPI00364523A6
MDWAGLVPAAAAAVQIAAVAVQAYWERRQRTVLMRHTDGSSCPAHTDDPVTVTAGITVQVGIVATAPDSPTVIVHVSESRMLLPLAKERDRW